MSFISKDDPRSVYHFYKRLIAIRKRYDVFIDGSYKLLLAEDRQIFAYLRKLEEETAIVIVNLSARQAFYHHPAYPLCSNGLFAVKLGYQRAQAPHIFHDETL